MVLRSVCSDNMIPSFITSQVLRLLDFLKLRVTCTPSPLMHPCLLPFIIPRLISSLSMLTIPQNHPYPSIPILHVPPYPQYTHVPVHHLVIPLPFISPPPYSCMRLWLLSILPTPIIPTFPTSFSPPIPSISHNTLPPPYPYL